MYALIRLSLNALGTDPEAVSNAFEWLEETPVEDESLPTSRPSDRRKPFVPFWMEFLDSWCLDNESPLIAALA